MLLLLRHFQQPPSVSTCYGMNAKKSKTTLSIEMEVIVQRLQLLSFVLGDSNMHKNFFFQTFNPGTRHTYTHLIYQSTSNLK